MRGHHKSEDVGNSTGKKIVRGKEHVMNFWGAGNVLFPDLSKVIWVFSLQVLVELYIQFVCNFVCISYHQCCASRAHWPCSCQRESWLCSLFPSPRSVTGWQLEISPGGNAYTTVTVQHHKSGLSGELV